MHKMYTKPISTQHNKPSTCSHGISVYLQVKPEDIRSALGCIVSEGDAPPNLSLKRLLEAKGYREIQLPTAEKAIHTTFPWRNRLSFFIAMKRVWDALINYQIVRVAVSC